ncbi:MAG: YicC family protein [Bacteroidetes bacterium CG2_30_33_31]|nr:MAG: YicC family protein [Bacteroidetes bacterium CG2_30_33_31]
MIKSMTGFGKAEFLNSEKRISVEIKSLNSKQADIGIRMPNIYNEKEIEIRSLITKELGRGKIYLQINVENLGNIPPVEINKALAIRYIDELKEIENLCGIGNKTDYISVISRMPDIVKSKNDTLGEDEFKTLIDILKIAIKNADTFRIEEGDILYHDFKNRINIILNLLEDIIPYENDRITKIRERIESELNNFSDDISIDKNRFEQELIFYLEKLDVTEEKVRLKKHCEYFMQTIDNDDIEKGKLLAFISQEIGREINTLGSKANDSNIQKIVVQMKDELEKIKEQMLNIL